MYVHCTLKKTFYLKNTRAIFWLVYYKITYHLWRPEILEYSEDH